MMLGSNVSKALQQCTVDGCEILHHQKDVLNLKNNGMFTTYQLGISLAHPQYHFLSTYGNGMIP